MRVQFCKTSLQKLLKYFKIQPMSKLTPQQFIQNVLIKEIGEIHSNHPYISFATMAIGIEFLGKCLNESASWNENFRSQTNFELAINELNSFTKYRLLLTSHKLWDSLRNGFLHSFVPKNSISLSSKNQAKHLQVISSTQINLRCEDFYIDFKGACEEVLKMKTFKSNKMNEPLLIIPDPVSMTPQILIPPINDIQVSGAAH
jgi:hypothetical protein